MKVVAVLIALAAPASAIGQAWTAETCSAALEHSYASFVARAGATTRGDFNSDGLPDAALLLDNMRGAHRSAIGVCLSKEPRPLLITAPYAAGTISTTPVGTRYTDSETGRTGAFERDAITVRDGGGARASYVLRVGVFARVIDGD